MPTYRFADCALDVSRRELTRGREAVKLSPRAFAVLEILVRTYPDAISRDDLYAAVWPDTFVSLTNLNNVVAEIRSAVGDESKRILVTKHRFGYAIGVPVIEGSAIPSRFALAIAGQMIVLREGDNLVGRSPDAIVLLDLPGISRHHAKIHVASDRATVEDLGSKNGTFIGDERITTARKLSDRDIICFGSICGTFRSARPGSTMTEPAR